MIWPLVGLMKPSRSRAIVVLPEPDSPATAVEVGNSLGTVSEASRSAIVVFPALLRMPLWKTLLTLRSSSSGVAIVSGPFGDASHRGRTGRGRRYRLQSFPVRPRGPPLAARRRGPPARRHVPRRSRPPSPRSSPPSARRGRAGQRTAAAAGPNAPDRGGRRRGGWVRPAGRGEPPPGSDRTRRDIADGR